MNRTCAVSEVKPGEIFTAEVGLSIGVFIKIDAVLYNVLNTGSWKTGSIDLKTEVKVIGKCSVQKYE